MRHFDVQLIGGMVLHRGKIAEMKTGEGKTLVATLPAYLNALAGQGVHVVTVNDYLARRDSEWMGRIYRFLGMTVGVIQHDLNDQERQVAYACRHHLRHQQRVRVRLPARQHEVRPRELRAARAQLRHRRRSRLDPDRRSAHAADHLGARGRIDGPLLRGRSHHPAAVEGRGDARRRQGRGSRGAREDRRLHRRREAQDRQSDRERHGQGREDAGAPSRAEHRRPVRPGKHEDPPPHQPGAARACVVPARRGVHGEGRRGRDRRRVHGTADAGPPLERRPAPGGGSQGTQHQPSRSEDRAREPDARDRHLPELLPQVQEAVGHDRHGRHRGVGIREHLQARRHGDPDQPRDAAHRGAGQRLPHREGEVRRDRHSTSSRSRRSGGRCSSAPCRSRSRSGCRSC